MAEQRPVTSPVAGSNPAPTAILDRPDCGTNRKALTGRVEAHRRSSRQRGAVGNPAGPMTTPRLRMTIIVLWLVYIAFCGGCASTPERISVMTPGHRDPAKLSIFPEVGFAGREATLSWRVPEGARSYCVEIEDYRTTCHPVAGRWEQWMVPAMPEGRYKITLTVEYADGVKRREASLEVCRSGIGFSCAPIEVNDDSLQTDSPF